MKFTFILGYRHKQDRYLNLRRVLNWMLSFEGSEIILIEQDKTSKLEQINLNLKYHFVYSDQPYNRSWAFNIGTKYASNGILIYTDSDLIIKNESLLKAVEMMKDYDVISPYDKVIDLSYEESKLHYDLFIKIKREGRGEVDNQTINLCGGMTIFTKAAIGNIGGWSEKFTTWGGEDDFQTIKVEKFLKYKILEDNCYHLFHNKQEIDMDKYMNNLKFLNLSKKFNEQQLINEINLGVRTNGKKNKFLK